jgi:hypothetical protein
MFTAAPDRKTVLVHLAKPAANGTAVNIDDKIVSTAPGTLVLALDYTNTPADMNRRCCR